MTFCFAVPGVDFVVENGAANILSECILLRSCKKFVYGVDPFIVLQLCNLHRNIGNIYDIH